MTTARLLADLARSTLTTWWRWLPLMGAWFLVGWSIRQLATQASVLLGGEHRGWAIVVFAIGVTCQVLATVGMTWMLKPTLRSPRLAVGADGHSTRAGVPDAVVRRESVTHVFLLSIGPFLAAYAVWNVIDTWVGDLYLANIAVNPLGVADDSWSVSIGTENLPLYATVGGIAFVGRLAYGPLARRLGSPLARLPLVFLEGVWAFCLFFITLMGLDQLQRWLLRRAFYVRATEAWDGFLAWLPGWRLPFDLTVPEALRALAAWCAEVLWPAVWQGFCFPLVWLALTAAVLGWRDFNLRALDTGRLPASLRRLTPRSPWFEGFVGIGALLTADLRDKYLPVVHALTLVWRSGPRLLGCFCLLYAVLQALQHWVHAGALLLFAPGDQIGFVGRMTALELPAELLVGTLTPVLLVSVLDRGVLATLARRDATPAAEPAAEPAVEPTPVA